MPTNAGLARGGRRRKLVLAALLGLTSAVLVFAFLQGQVDTPRAAPSAPVATLLVLTAAREIAANEAIQPDMLVLKQVAPDAVVEGAFSALEEAGGTIARFPMSAGEQITPLKVTRGETDGGLSSVVPDGKLAMAIAASAVVTAGGILRPGDRVDVIAVVDQDPERPIRGTSVGAAVSVVLVERAEVLAVAQQIVQRVPPALSDGGAASAEPMTVPGAADEALDANAATVTLALTLDESQSVLLYERLGQLRLLVRPSVTIPGGQ